MKSTVLRFLIVFSLVIGSSSFVGCGISSAQQQEQSVDSVIQAGAFLVDVRTPEEFANGNVPGSVNVPLAEIENNLELFKNKENIVVFCQSGGRSSQAKKILDKQGIKNVFNGGGWNSVLKIVTNK